MPFDSRDSRRALRCVRFAVFALASLLWAFTPAAALADTAACPVVEDIHWQDEPMHPDLSDLPSLQRGFRHYVNYCLGCHGLKYQRYERTADDLGIPHDLVKEHLIFSDQMIGDLMTTAMPDTSAAWFGVPPPDLTLVAKLRDTTWLYNYLNSFYSDPCRPLGVNNKVFPNVGMPHVLASLQGNQRPVCKQVPVLAANGGEARDPLVPGRVLTEEQCGLLEVEEGTASLSAEEYRQFTWDIVNFLYYVAEPARMDRYRIGVYVILFLIFLGVFTWLLNREYWKDVR